MEINQIHHGSGDNVAGDKYSINPKAEILGQQRTADGALEIMIGDKHGLPLINLGGRVTAETALESATHAVVAKVSAFNGIMGEFSPDRLSYSFEGSLDSSNFLLLTIHPYCQVKVELY